MKKENIYNCNEKKIKGGFSNFATSHCVIYRNFTWFPRMEILWEGTVSAEFSIVLVGKIKKNHNRKPKKPKSDNFSLLGAIHIWHPSKLSYFQDPPHPLSIYVRSLSTPWSWTSNFNWTPPLQMIPCMRTNKIKTK